MKRAAALVGVAIAGSEAGHLLAYGLRFGAAAQQMQATGSHAYFPLLAKTLLGAAALALIASMVLVGFARIASGRKIDRASAPSLLRLLAVLYTLQLAFFIAQEALEGNRAGDLFLWGLVGQLPVALAAAVAVRWLFASLGPAVASIVHPLELVLNLGSALLPLVPAPRPALVAARPLRIPISRRGPPPSF